MKFVGDACVPVALLKTSSSFFFSFICCHVGVLVLFVVFGFPMTSLFIINVLKPIVIVMDLHSIVNVYIVE